MKIKCKICGYGSEYVGMYRPETTCPLCSGITQMVFFQQPETVNKKMKVYHINDNFEEEDIKKGLIPIQKQTPF